MRTALAFTILLAASVLAGCAGPGGGESTNEPDGNTPTTPMSSTPPAGAVTAPPPSNAQFELSAITITPKGDDNRTTLYEDDEGAAIRYTVSQPADARRETAFVTYLLNGRIVDVQQLTLQPGESKEYERSVGELRGNRTIKVEVRAGSAVQRAEAKVVDWPRAGEGALAIGPVSVRADYGLLQQDSRAIVNLTITNNGPEQTFRDFRVKMLCLDDKNEVEETSSVRLEAPTVGNTTSLDVSVEECSGTRYGLEFKATGENGTPLVGRLLLVPKGWTPAQAGSTQA